MSDISILEFVEIFKNELETDLDENSQFKMQQKWSSLNSLIIINEIELRSGVVLSAEDIMQTETIKELYERTKYYMALNK